MSEQRQAPVLSGWWWLTFSAPERPAGEWLVGTAVVQALSQGEAVDEAFRLDIFPEGCGQVGWCALVDGQVPCAEWRDRLLPPGDSYELRSWFMEKFGPGGVAGRDAATEAAMVAEARA